MNVRQLSDHLNRLVLAGRGDDSVFAQILGDFDEHTLNALDRCNWVVTDVDLNDDRSNFVGLDCRPDA